MSSDAVEYSFWKIEKQEWDRWGVFKSKDGLEIEVENR